ncbi:unnamed protein product [Rhizoctonia solani]|uniref:Hemerythrin-like domain-containing protein n=1 Tax=Rhizoctonia solani TaxID=456999 RepID=A0A8H3GWN9_9AGAM|nr:unnamed protein product [Rhizoctonia solani]
MDVTYPLFPTPPGDWRKNVFALQSIRMAAIYNIIIRTLNSIIYHAHVVDKTDVHAFMRYCQNLATFVRYHTMVEDFIFLYLEMNLPGAQRDLIPDAMDLRDLNSWFELCSSIREGKVKYHSDKVLSLLKQFADPLFVHMEETMAVLEASLLKKHIQIEMLASFEAELEAKNRNDCLPFSAAPLLMLNSDCEHNPWFPPVPSAAILVLRYIMIPLNSNTWKFSQCDAYMRPKDKLNPPKTESMMPPSVTFHITAGLLSLALSYFLYTLVVGHSVTP